MAEKERRKNMYRPLMNRFWDLEASHEKLSEQLKMVAREKEEEEQRRRRRRRSSWGGEGTSSDSGGDVSWDPSLGRIPGFYSSGGPYGKVLQSMGHAVHVFRISDGRIIYWNHSAETLYGWKDYEVLGKGVADLLVEEHNHPVIEQIMKRLSTGRSWLGQFPFKKKSGEIFKALVTKSPLYEDGELVGVVVVSSNATVFNIINSENERQTQDHAHVPPGERKFNLKKIQWNLQPQTASMPQISSSVSNLASKAFSRRHGDDRGGSCNGHASMRRTRKSSFDNEVESVSAAKSESKLSFRLRIGKNPTKRDNCVNEEPMLGFVRPSKIAAKVLEKLHIGEGSNIQEESSRVPNSSLSNSSANRSTRGTPLCHPKIASETAEANAKKSNYADGFRCEYSDGKSLRGQDASEAPSATCKTPFANSWLQCHECYQMPRFSPEWEEKNGAQLKMENSDEVSEAEATTHQRLQAAQSPPLLSSADVTSSSRKNSSAKEDKEPNSVVDCEINWEDLHLGEEIGQGSYAVVYRGIWNGSDVAIKVYFESEYRESTLLDYRKEIAIMKSLRHPNVLLFMGAVYSPERLAIVTEFLPRGSLFKTVHRNNQKLDAKRRLRMALDVARGMNYLHCRNPPIVHRDLKSTNLLVDRNWNVKVGDFGLSKWRNATFLTAKSGIGSPQWMAPEVLRNEPSNEKSDVFSFGVILWELMTESIPWADLNSLQVVGIVGFMDSRLDIPESLDPQISSIICDCWQSEPGCRPSFQDLIHKVADAIRRFPPFPPPSPSAVKKNSVF